MPALPSGVGLDPARWARHFCVAARRCGYGDVPEEWVQTWFTNVAAWSAKHERELLACRL